MAKPMDHERPEIPTIMKTMPITRNGMPMAIPTTLPAPLPVPRATNIPPVEWYLLDPAPP